MFSNRYIHAGFSPLARMGVAQFGGSKGGSSQVQTAYTNSTTGPPAWAQNASKDLYNNSMDVADKLQPTAIAAPAALTPGQLSLIQSLQGNVGAANPAYANAQGTLARLQGYTPQSVTAGQLANTDLSPYMNPYTNDVINSSLALGRQQLAQGINQTADNAIGAGAFGGSRQGVQEGVANAQYGLGAANLAAGLNAQNFSQAQAAAGQDIATRFNADLANQQAGLNGAGLNLNAANSSAAVAGQQQQTYLQGLLAALSGQGMIQGQQQAENQYGADVANANNMLPYQRLAIQQGTLSGVPLSQTTNGTTTSTTQQGGGSGVMQGIGGGLGLATSLLSPLGGAQGAFGAGAGTFGSSILGALWGLSDKRVKEDLGRVGTGPDGVPIHRWRYKGGDQVFTGPFAQDVEDSRYSGAVHENARGVKMINQAAVPAGLRVKRANGLSLEPSNPQWRRKRKGRR